MLGVKRVSGDRELNNHALFRRRRAGLFWIMCIGLLTLLLWLGSYRVHRLSVWRLRCWAWFQQLQVLVNIPVDYLGGWMTTLSDGRSWYLRYQRLADEHQHLVAQSMQLEDLRQSNRSLAALLQLAIADDKEKNGWLAASLVSAPQAQFEYRFIIDKGVTDHITIGQMVVTERGVVGRIDVVTQHTSVVLPVVSTDSVVPVKVVRTERNCFCKGAGPNKLQLLDMPASADIQIGDQLVTSDLGGGWLPGYLVGKVCKISNTSDQIFLTVEVEPSVDCWQLRNVLILQ